MPASPLKLQSTTVPNLLMRHTVEKQSHKLSVIEEQAHNLFESPGRISLTCENSTTTKQCVVALPGKHPAQ